MMLLFVVVILCLSVDICERLEKEPNFDDFEFDPSIVDKNFNVEVSFPLFYPKNRILSRRKYFGEGGFDVSLKSSNPFVFQSICSSSTYYELEGISTTEDFEDSREFAIKYSKDSMVHKYSYLLNYQLKNYYISCPVSFSADSPVFQIIKVEEKMNFKIIYMEVRYNQKFDIDFKGAVSELPTNMEVIDQSYVIFEDYYIARITITLMHPIKKEFKKDTFFFLINDVSFATDVILCSYGYFVSTPMMSEHGKAINDSFSLSVGKYDVSKTHPNHVRGLLSITEFGNEVNDTFLPVGSYSTKERLKIVMTVSPEDYFLNQGFISGVKLTEFEIILKCDNCEKPYPIVFNKECMLKTSKFNCLFIQGGNSETIENTNITLNLATLDPGYYEIFGKSKIIITFEDGSDKKVNLWTYTRIFVSQMKKPQSYFEFVLITTVAALGLFTTTGGVGIGVFVMRTAQFHDSKKNNIRGTKCGGVRAIESKNGSTFPLLVMNYDLRHKDIGFSEEEKGLLNRKFVDVYKLQKASKYTPYVHCKHCYLEQKEAEISSSPNSKDEENKSFFSGDKSRVIDDDGPICIKCGLPLLQYIGFTSKDTFCVMCSMLNKYQPRPHGRCLLHVSLSSRESVTSKKKKNGGEKYPRNQGAVYVLFRDLFSIGSISRQIKKKSKKKALVDKITKPQVWRLNSLMRFEFMSILRELVHEELIYLESREEYSKTIKLLETVRLRVIQRISEVGKDMKSEFLKRLKIDLRDEIFFVDGEVALFCDKFRQTLVTLVSVLSRQIQFLKDMKINTSSGRKRKDRTDSWSIPLIPNVSSLPKWLASGILENYFPQSSSPLISSSSSGTSTNSTTSTSSNSFFQSRKRMKNISGSMVVVSSNNNNNNNNINMPNNLMKIQKSPPQRPLPQRIPDLEFGNVQPSKNRNNSKSVLRSTNFVQKPLHPLPTNFSNFRTPPFNPLIVEKRLFLNTSNLLDSDSRIPPPSSISNLSSGSTTSLSNGTLPNTPFSNGSQSSKSKSSSDGSPHSPHSPSRNNLDPLDFPPSTFEFDDNDGLVQILPNYEEDSFENSILRNDKFGDDFGDGEYENNVFYRQTELYDQKVKSDDYNLGITGLSDDEKKFGGDMGEYLDSLDAENFSVGITIEDLSKDSIVRERSSSIDLV